MTLLGMPGQLSIMQQIVASQKLTVPLGGVCPGPGCTARQTVPMHSLGYIVQPSCCITGRQGLQGLLSKRAPVIVCHLLVSLEHSLRPIPSGCYIRSQYVSCKGRGTACTLFRFDQCCRARTGCNRLGACGPEAPNMLV